jgi:hypothetical protein
MVGRAIAAVCIAVAIGCSVAGCQSTPAGSFTRTLAQADVAAWTRQVVAAAGSSGSVTKLNAFDTCRSDTGLFPTSSQWRTVTYADVQGNDQTAATRAIESAMEHARWKLTTPRGVVMLTGPNDQKRRGLIIIQSGGPSQLAISVISPCYP